MLLLYNFGSQSRKMYETPLIFFLLQINNDRSFHNQLPSFYNDLTELSLYNIIVIKIYIYYYIYSLILLTCRI